MRATDVAASVPDDGALVARALDGDHDSFALLFRRHGPGVHAFAQRRLRSVDLADDVTSLAFEHAWVGLDRLGARHGDRFRPWVFRIAANEMASMMRSSERRRDRDHLSARRGAVEHERGLAADEFAAVDTAIDTAPILAAMSELPERHQTVLMLRFLADLSPSDTALAMSVSVGNVAVMTHRAVAALRRQVDREVL